MSLSFLHAHRPLAALFQSRILPPLIFLRTSHHTSSDLPPIPPDLPSLRTNDDKDQARSWIEQFKSYTIPKSLVDMTFSRSSGPGGQVCNHSFSEYILTEHYKNVNKVNTKATLRCPVDSPWIPAWSRRALTGTVRGCLLRCFKRWGMNEINPTEILCRFF